MQLQRVTTLVAVTPGATGHVNHLVLVEHRVAPELCLRQPVLLLETPASELQSVALLSGFIQLRRINVVSA